MKSHTFNLTLWINQKYDVTFVYANFTYYMKRKMKEVGPQSMDLVFEASSKISYIANDYDLKLYFAMLMGEGKCTFKDLCDTLGYSFHSTNIDNMKLAMKRLHDIGLISHVKYGYEKGKKGKVLSYDIEGRYLGEEESEEEERYFPPTTFSFAGAYHRAKEKKFIDEDEEDFDFGI